MFLPFDVNNPELRRAFLEQHLLEAIDTLDEKTQPRWGKMTAQHMIEHLLWAFEISTGRIDVGCAVPQSHRERIKGFLYDETPTPREFKNPVLTEALPVLSYASLTEAKAALQQEISHFFAYKAEHPEAAYRHPLFGLLGLGEWERVHYKHGYHHLLQFGLVKEVEAGAV